MVERENKAKKNISKFYLLILLSLCVVFGRAFIYQVKEKNRLNAQIKVLEENKFKLNKEIETIKSDLKDVESEDFIKRVARDKLKMVEKNEVIIKYKD